MTGFSASNFTRCSWNSLSHSSRLSKVFNPAPALGTSRGGNNKTNYLFFFNFQKWHSFYAFKWNRQKSWKLSNFLSKIMVCLAKQVIILFPHSIRITGLIITISLIDTSFYWLIFFWFYMHFHWPLKRVKKKKLTHCTDKELFILSRNQASIKMLIFSSKTIGYFVWLNFGIKAYSCITCLWTWNIIEHDSKL